MTFLPGGEGVSSVGTMIVCLSWSDLPENVGVLPAYSPR
jgi:hypothetical protein